MCLPTVLMGLSRMHESSSTRLSTSVQPGELLCPECGYDTYGRRRNSICPECGLAITEELLSALLPWEHKTSNVSLLSKWAATTKLLFLAPRATYSQLAARTNRPISCSRELSATYLVACLGMGVCSSLISVAFHCLAWVFTLGEHLTWSYIAMRVGWIPYSLEIYLLETILPWVVIWLVVAGIASSFISHRGGVSRYSSVLAVFGPIVLASSFAACALELLDSLVPYSVRAVLVYVRMFGSVGLLALWAYHIWEFCRRLRADVRSVPPADVPNATK